MVNVIWGATDKPVSSQRLAQKFETEISDDGDLFIGYPIIATPEGAFPIDALLISPTRGTVIFDLIEGREIGNYSDRQDEAANKLETKLRSHRPLMAGRTLLAVPNVITFAPVANLDNIATNGYVIANDASLAQKLNEQVGYHWENDSVRSSVVSVIQSISTIRRNKRVRKTASVDSRGSKLKRLEDSIATLDLIQGRAVIETVDNVQRIRGLAGSGKTIILALKAAYLHARYPDWKIAVTFNTRSLKEQFRRLITTFVIEQSGDEPDWDQLSILNAWGKPGGKENTGIYYEFCQDNNVEYLDFRTARQKYGYNEAFNGACKAALNATVKANKLYDVILVDEAQDFDPAFLNMCYDILGEKKRLVYAYDELQSLSDHSLPPPEELFGRDSQGRARVVFADVADAAQPQQDIILEKCYRNSRPVLATAHALGFGIYRQPHPKTKTGLIQMFENNQLWIDVGYSVKSGNLEDNETVRLARTSQSSPSFLEDHSPIDDLIQFHCFEDAEAQAEWLAEAIRRNLSDDELNYDDIIVINPDPLSTPKVVGKPRRMLWDLDINSHLSGVDTSPDVFFDAENSSVAFTGIFRAKGNEAGMVYVINAQDCFSSPYGLATVRNQLFTAITRSKAWVRVLGIGDNMRGLIKEFDAVKNMNFELDFTVPDEATRKHINIVNREKTVEEKKNIQNNTVNIAKFLSDVEGGRVLIDELPADQIEKLRKILDK